MKDKLVLQEELENLREKLNKDFVRYIEDRNKEEYKNLLSLSKELDEVIVAYMKNSSEEVKN
jgi:predicted house-cleaning noncanonical NTP pyrophosphatase (MazG superfamily)